MLKHIPVDKSVVGYEGPVRFIVHGPEEETQNNFVPGLF